MFYLTRDFKVSGFASQTYYVTKNATPDRIELVADKNNAKQFKGGGSFSGHPIRNSFVTKNVVEPHWIIQDSNGLVYALDGYLRSGPAFKFHNFDTAAIQFMQITRVYPDHFIRIVHVK